MCGIEDLMANTMLVQAKNDTAANNKWRKNFRLPSNYLVLTFLFKHVNVLARM